MDRSDLKPGDICPCCGQKIRGYTTSEKRRAASLAALAARKSKGGRPKGSKNKPKVTIKFSGTNDADGGAANLRGADGRAAPPERPE